MIITKEQLKSYEPCREGYKWFIKNFGDETELSDVIEELIKQHEEIYNVYKYSINSGYEWADWLLMSLACRYGIRRETYTGENEQYLWKCRPVERSPYTEALLREITEAINKHHAELEAAQ